MKFNCLSPAKKMIIHCAARIEYHLLPLPSYVQYIIVLSFDVYNYNTSNEIECNANSEKCQKFRRATSMHPTNTAFIFLA